MNDADHRYSGPAARKDAPVHCAECGAFNERESIQCHGCGSHLWIKCSKCGAKVLRSSSRCAKCRQRLRRNKIAMALPNWNRLLRNRKRRRLVGGILLLLLTAVGIWLAIQSLPEPYPPPPDTAVPD